MPRYSNPFRLMVSILLALLPWCSSVARAAPETERLQAAMIFNLAKFVRWTDTETAGSAFELCLVKAGAVAKHLEAARGRKVGKLSLNIRSVTPVMLETAGCHAVFYGDDLDEPIQRTHLLTIGLRDSFLDRGGMIGLDIESNKLVFDINLLVLREQQLDLSAQVLALARSVR